MYDADAQKAVMVLKGDLNAMSAPEIYGLLKSVAKRQRKSGQSEQQAFATLVSEDPDGRELYAFYKAAHTAALYGSHVVMKGDRRSVSKSIDDPTGALAKLRKIADGIRRDQGVTQEKAMLLAIQTPDGARLYLENRRARLG